MHVLVHTPELVQSRLCHEHLKNCPLSASLNGLDQFRFTATVGGAWVWWPMPVIPTVRRLRQDGHCEFEVSLGYTVSSRSACAAVRYCLRKLQRKQGKEGRKEEEERKKKNGEL